MSAAAWASCLFAAGAAGLAVSSPPRALLTQRLGIAEWAAAAADPGRLGLPGARRQPRDAAHRWARLLTSRGVGRTCVVVGVLTVGGTSLVVGPVAIGTALVAAAVTVAVVRIRLARQRAREHAARRAGVIEMCDVLASELRAGRALPRALEVAASASGELAQAAGPVVTANRMGGDVVGALRGVQDPGAEGLWLLAAAWETARESGTALAEVLDRIGESLRAEEELRREVRAQLAAPRATARLLALLPGFGLALGSATGAQPFGQLFGTVYGLACLVLGGGLGALGLIWVERLAHRAEALR